MRLVGICVCVAIVTLAGSASWSQGNPVGPRRGPRSDIGSRDRPICRRACSAGNKAISPLKAMHPCAAIPTKSKAFSANCQPSACDVELEKSKPSRSLPSR